MDVERIQKVNNLALDLLKKGLVQNREEAVREAEKIFREKAADYSDLRETMEEVSREANPAPRHQEDLSQEKIRDILQQNTQFLVKTIQEFQSQMKVMEDELSTVREKLAQLRASPAQEQKTLERADPPLKGPVSHPRSGNYAEEDISVEKFFYTGSRR